MTGFTVLAKEQVIDHNALAEESFTCPWKKDKEQKTMLSPYCAETK